MKRLICSALILALSSIGAFCQNADAPAAVGAKPGEVQRIIRPFLNWTLVCDENLIHRTRVCNINQTVVDGSRRKVVSVAVAQTDGGASGVVVRTPRLLAGSHLVIEFGPVMKVEGDKPDCGPDVCASVLALDGVAQSWLLAGKEMVIHMNIVGDDGKPVEKVVPVTGVGLKDALAVLAPAKTNSAKEISPAKRKS